MTTTSTHPDDGAAGERTYPIRLTKDELWEVMAAISHSGSDPNPSMETAEDKISTAYAKAKQKEAGQ